MDDEKKNEFWQFVVRCDKTFLPYQNRKLFQEEPVGMVTQYELAHVPRLEAACTSWKIEKNKVRAKGITLGKDITERRVILALEHEVIHDVIGRLVSVKAGWEFDNCIYADYQRKRMDVMAQVYNDFYINYFFSNW